MTCGYAGSCVLAMTNMTRISEANTKFKGRKLLYKDKGCRKLGVLRWQDVKVRIKTRIEE
jgi:hypothetical protein